MNTLDFFHGAILLRIVNDNASKLQRYQNNNSSYIINDQIGIYCKYSQKRISPWIFSFSQVHIDEIKRFEGDIGNLFIVLLCNNNGICCLNFQEFCTILSIESKNFPKWIKASRLKGEKYSVSGSDGKLKYKIGNIDFPHKIYG